MRRLLASSVQASRPPKPLLMADYNQSSLNDRFDKLAKETLESLKSYIEQVFSRQNEALMDGVGDLVRSCDAALRHDFNILQASSDASCH